MGVDFMKEKEILWDNNLLELLCRAVGCDKRNLKESITELANELEIRLTQKTRI
jgi:hypothetical protein